MDVSLRWWTVIGLLVAGLTGTLLWLIATHTKPTQLMQPIFLSLLGITLTGLTIPPAAYLNRRFARSGWLKQDPYRLLRQGAEVGLFVTVCGWLQKEDFLTWTLAAIITSVLVLMEAFFLTRSDR
jgi:hypothetical protein